MQTLTIEKNIEKSVQKNDKKVSKNRTQKKASKASISSKASKLIIVKQKAVNVEKKASDLLLNTLVTLSNDKQITIAIRVKKSELTSFKKQKTTLDARQVCNIVYRREILSKYAVKKNRVRNVVQNVLAKHFNLDRLYEDYSK